MYLGTIVGLSVAARFIYVYAHRALPPSTDGFGYDVLAVQSIAKGRWFVSPFSGMPTAFHPPAWPLLLALPARLGLSTLLDVQLVALALGTGTVILIALAARAVAGERVGLIAAGIASVYPSIWIWERELASETLVLPLVALMILLAYRLAAKPRLLTVVALGAVCGVLTLTRAEQLLVFVFVLVPVIVANRRPLPRGGLARLLAAASLAFVAVLAPWLGYNATRFAHPVVVDTELGSTLRDSNDHFTYNGAWVGSIDFTHYKNMLRRPGDETQLELLDRHVGLQYIRQHFSRLPVVVLAREGRTWGVFNAGQSTALAQTWGNDPLWLYRIALVMYWLLAAAAVAGVLELRRRRVMLIPLLAPLLIVAVATALTYGEPRFRASAEVPLVLLAAAGIDAAVRSVTARRRGPTSRQGASL